MLTTENSGFTPETASAVKGLILKGSAFQAAAPQGSIPLNGVDVRTLKVAELLAFGVREGMKKAVLDAKIVKKTVKPSKKAFIVVTTTEAEAIESVAPLFENRAPGWFGQEFDLNVAGLLADPEGRIDALTAATNRAEVTVTDGASLKKAFAEASVDEPTAWVMSTALKAHIIGLDANETDRKLSAEILTGTLLGVPVKTFRSNELIGFLRNFSEDEWDLTGGVRYRRALDGVVTDSQGVTHNLTQDNKVAHILEGFFGWTANLEHPTVVLRGAVEVDPEG